MKTILQRIIFRIIIQRERISTDDLRNYEEIMMMKESYANEIDGSFKKIPMGISLGQRRANKL